MSVDNTQSMAVDNLDPHDTDLDRTDRLPILDGAIFEDDVEDDAVRMDYAPLVPSVKAEFAKPAGVDLPSLAESVRSVEERIARQNAEYEALNRSFEKSRDAEAVAASRAAILSSELEGVRALLQTEQARAREIDKTLVDKDVSLDATRARIEEALSEAERYRSEARTLRDTLDSRDAAIVHVTHSLGERDAQLKTLEREHAAVVPALEQRSKANAQLEADLHAERLRADGTAAALKKTQETAAHLAARLRAGEDDLAATRRDFGLIKTQAASYLENLRTREWRRGFDHNLYRELDAKIGAVQDDRGTLQLERDQLRQRVTEMESKLAAQDEVIEGLRAAAVKDQETRDQNAIQLNKAEIANTHLTIQVNTLEGDAARLQDELTERDEKIAQMRSAALAGEALRLNHAATLRQAEEARTELDYKIAALERERGCLKDDLALRDDTIATLNAAAESYGATRSQHDLALQQMERARTELAEKITALESAQGTLHGELALRDQAMESAEAKQREQATLHQQLLAEADHDQAKLATQIERLQSEVHKRDGEIAVLTSKLQEARRPIEPIEAENKRLTDDLTARATSIEQLNEENRTLRGALERTRGALEEREFLIRRLERSESNNANVLGRIQTSIERLGFPSTTASSAVAPVECVAELLRVDGSHKTSYTLGRRTRIGRAPGCELQIESTSVSRHHAMMLMNSRDVIVEDLNSTNGVLVNGRKVTRQLLHDGDVLTIGEAQFRLSVKFAPRALEAPAPESP